MSRENLLILGDVVVPPGGAGPHPDNVLAGLLREAKHVSCNLEGIPSRGWNRRAKAGAWVDQHPTVNALLRSLGVDLFCMANNHVGDYGAEALEAYVAIMDGIVFGVGKGPKDAARPTMLELNGAQVAMFACAEGEFGVLVGSEAKFGANWMGHPSFHASIRAARAVSDFVIVQVHTGVEETPIPLPKARNALRSIVEMGADLIVCHHAHCVQGWEQYGTGLIFYGIGNAYFPPPTPLTSVGWNNGIALRICVGEGLLQVEPFELEFQGPKWNARSTNGWLERHELPAADDPEYIEKSRLLALMLWEERYRSYYRVAMGAPGSFKETIRALANLLNVRRTRSRIPNPQLLLHNIRIESHRWAVEAFLEDGGI